MTAQQSAKWLILFLICCVCFLVICQVDRLDVLKWFDAREEQYRRELEELDKVQATTEEEKEKIRQERLKVWKEWGKHLRDNKK